MSKMQVPNLCTWPPMGQVAEGEDETLKILAASSEFILTVSVLTNAVYSLRSYDADGIRWRVTGLVDRKRRVVYGLEIHPTKDPVGENGWYEVPLN